MTTELVLGIDIGGSGIKAGIVDVDEGKLTAKRLRVKTPEGAAPKAVVRALRMLTAAPELRVAKLAGVGFPAAIQAGIARTAANIDPLWIGANVAELLSEAVGVPTTAVNDADAAGLAEVRFGAGRGQNGVVVMVTLGTGIGTGLFWNGHLVPNSELGHLQIRGRDAEDRAAASVREQKRLSWTAWAKQVQEFLEVLDRLVSPDLVIIGGGVSATPEKFLPKIKIVPRLVAASLGNDAGIIGAALYASESPARLMVDPPKSAERD